MPHYDPPSGTYTSTIPPGIAAARRQLARHYGLSRTEVVRDRDRCARQRSEHCEARAIDAFSQFQPHRRLMFTDLVRLADTLGVQSVIADRRVWGFGTWTERDYTGPNPHTDHVHVGFTKHAARTLTDDYVRRALAGPEHVRVIPPAPATEDHVVYIRLASGDSGAVYRVGPVLEHVSADEWDALVPKPDVLDVPPDHPLYRRPKLLAADFDPR
jgi:hypothetical protein